MINHASKEKTVTIQLIRKRNCKTGRREPDMKCLKAASYFPPQHLIICIVVEDFRKYNCYLVYKVCTHSQKQANEINKPTYGLWSITLLKTRNTNYITIIPKTCLTK